MSDRSIAYKVFYRGAIAIALVAIFLALALYAYFGGTRQYNVCPTGMVGWYNRGAYVCFTPLQNTILIALFGLGAIAFASCFLYWAFHPEIWREQIRLARAERAEPEKWRRWFGAKKE